MQPADTPAHPATAPAKKARGGARPGGGVKAADGAAVKRVQLMLDADTLATFTRLGLGNVSLGAREAARMLGTPARPADGGAAPAAAPGQGTPTAGV